MSLQKLALDILLISIVAGMSAIQKTSIASAGMVSPMMGMRPAIIKTTKESIIVFPNKITATASSDQIATNLDIARTIL